MNFMSFKIELFTIHKDELSVSNFDYLQVRHGFSIVIGLNGHIVVVASVASATSWFETTKWANGHGFTQSKQIQAIAQCEPRNKVAIGEC